MCSLTGNSSMCSSFIIITCEKYNSIIYVSRYYIQGQGLSLISFVIFNTILERNNIYSFKKVYPFDFYPFSFSHQCARYERTSKENLLLTNYTTTTPFVDSYSYSYFKNFTFKIIIVKMTFCHFFCVQAHEFKHTYTFV